MTGRTTTPTWIDMILSASRSEALRRDVQRLDDARLRRAPALAAIASYRFAHWSSQQTGLRRKVARLIAAPLSLTTTITLGIDIPESAQIGGGFVINHFGGIFFESTVVIGEDCSICQGVTIGNRTPGGPTPVIGDNVEVGAYAQILGGVTIGDGAKIGAMSVVLKDVPAGATVVGNPGRILGS